MILHPPFIITSYLKPGIQVENLTITLVDIKRGFAIAGIHDRAKFILDFDDGRRFRDESMGLSLNGDNSLVSIFASFLGFLASCGEAGPGSDLFTLFCPPIAEWASENYEAIWQAKFAMHLDDCEQLNHHLIEGTL